MQRRALIFFFLLVLCTVSFGQSSQNCPTVSFVKPTGMLAPGEPNDFRVALSNVDHPEKISYTWGTSLGKIVSGFGTPAIKLLVSKEDGYHNLTVFVRVDGLPDSCKSTVSDTFAVAGLIPDERFIHSFGLVSWGQTQAVIDDLLMMSESNPTFRPIIVMRFAANERDSTRLRRLREILRALRFRKLVAKVSFAIVETPSRTESAVGLQAADVELKLENEQFVLIKAAELDKNPRRILGTNICNCYRKIT